MSYPCQCPLCDASVAKGFERMMIKESFPRCLPGGRLNAPPGYHWQDADVRFEKNQSWHNGFLWGLLAASLIWFAVMVLAWT